LNLEAFKVEIARTLGTDELLQGITEWLAQWQGVQADQVLTGNGSLELIEFLCRQMIQPGDVVFTESPTYDRVLTLLRRHRARVIGIPLEPDGPSIEALEAALREHVPKFFYVIPDFQNPAGIAGSVQAGAVVKPER